MRTDIWDIVDYAHEKGLHPVIGTNGTLIDDECARQMAAHGIPRVSVSLDFPTAEGQDAFRGRRGAFEEALAGVRNLRAHGVGVQVNMTITKMNSHLVDEMHELALKEDAEAFHPFLLVPTGRGEDLVDVELTPDEYEEVLTWAYHCQKESPLHFKPTDAPQYYRIIRQLAAAEGREVTPATYGMEAMTRGCLGGITFAFISHVGDVQPCGYFDMQLGNVKDELFSHIWETSPVFDDLRHYDRLKGKCGACEYKGVCGGCRARALAATGDYLAEEPYCAYVPHVLAQQRVLDEIQSGFPLEHDPYGVLAQRIGLTRGQVLEAVESLRADGRIRQIGASLSSKRLGYVSTLCALSVPGSQQDVDRAADLVSAHPHVTHNYQRDAEFNVWFTAIAPSYAHLDQLVDEVSAETGCEVLNLPVTKLYKIKVDFGAARRSRREGADVAPANARAAACGAPLDAAPADSSAAACGAPFDAGPSESSAAACGPPFDAANPFDRALVHWASRDVTGVNPFADAAAFVAGEIGDSSVGEEDIIQRLREWKAAGTIRRFGAFVHHRKLGYSFNGMTVWDAPEDEADDLGRAFAALPFVSHCYKRVWYDMWPYNLYAMVHAKSQEELDGYVAQMREMSGLDARVILSTKEFKKSLPVYFE